MWSCMKQTFPPDTSLDDSKPLRIYRADAPLIKAAKKETGLDELEIKRRAIHVGLPQLAKLLGVTLEEKEKGSKAA